MEETLTILPPVATPPATVSPPPPVSPPEPPPPVTTVSSLPNPPQGSSHGKAYFAMLMLFIIGIGMGYVLKAALPDQKEGAMVMDKTSTVMTLPSDAVQIQACSDHRGTLYIRPQDIPVGPVYMVHNGAIVGIEYMLSKEEFLNGKSFKYLSAANAQVDHVNIGLVSEGHEGYAVQHFHVDMYTVPQSVEDAIVCPKSAATLQPTASVSAEPSARVTGRITPTPTPASASGSAQPSASVTGRISPAL